MTQNEVKQSMKKVVAIVAEGMACGYKHVQIIDYDFSKKTMWGKGIVIYRNMDNMNHRVSACLTQVELYHGETQRRIKRKKNNVEVKAETTVKNSRRRRTTSRRRNRDV